METRPMSASTSITERRWIAKMRRLLRDKPTGLVLFADGDLHIMRATDTGCVPMSTDLRDPGADPEAIVESIQGACEGGAW